MKQKEPHNLNVEYIENLKKKLKEETLLKQN
jgi:hypothetical protein